MITSVKLHKRLPKDTGWIIAITVFLGLFFVRPLAFLMMVIYMVGFG